MFRTYGTKGLCNWSCSGPTYKYIHMRCCQKLLVHEKDINIIWKGPIANHSFVAILTSLCHIDLQGVSLRLKAAKVDMILYL